MRYGMIDFSKCYQSYEKTINKVLQMFFDTLLDKTTMTNMKETEEQLPFYDCKDLEMFTIDGMNIKVKAFFTRHNLNCEFDKLYGITGTLS